MVLIQLRQDRGHQPLTEGAVQRIVYLFRGHTEPGRRVAIDDDHGPAPAVLLVAGNVGQLRARPEGGEEPVRPCRELGGVGMLEAELILRPADAILDRQILNRLHVQRDAGDVGER